MVLEGLCYPDGVEKYCRSKRIPDTLFYKWKNQLEKNAKIVFALPVRESAREMRLKDELVRKDTIISELVEENIAFKKRMDYSQSDTLTG